MIDSPEGNNGAAANIMTHDMTATNLFFSKRMMASTRVGFTALSDAHGEIWFSDKRPAESVLPHI
ncbi:hypothetical protein [Pseudomonas bananamidigenes]|uniref:hypothetical protein n=1 Tax=Pseudomonas bananamidigenes TaxID=2843610 RepID=UPI00159EF1E1|nr:hypothetical protein [Pseudomonas bananamidigenes]